MNGRISRVAIGVAALVLLGACSNHSGLRALPPPSEGVTSAVPGPTPPNGLAGAKSRAARTPTPSRSAPSTAAGAGSAAAARSTHDRAGSGATTSRVGTSGPAPRSSAPGPSGPRVAVSPSTGLADGQHVQVTGSGLAPSTYVWIRECLAGAGSCAPAPIFWVSTDGSGRVSRTIAVTASIYGHACGAHGCVVSIREPDGTTVSAPISFR